MESFIGLIPTIKKSYSLIFRNENLGFLIKSSIVGFFISMLMLLPVFLLMFIANTTLTGAISENSLKNESLYNYDRFETSATQQIQTAIATNSTPDTTNWVLVAVFYLLMIPLMLLVSGFSVTFFLITAIRIYEGNIISIKELIKLSFKKMWGVAAVLAIQAMVVFVGFILLIIPALIFGIMFMFAPYIAVGENCGPIAALKKSKQLTSGYKLNLFGKGVGFTGLMILFAIPLGILMGISFYGGVSSVFSYLFSFFHNMLFIIMYKDLMRVKAAAAVSPVVPQIPAESVPAITPEQPADEQNISKQSDDKQPEASSDKPAEEKPAEQVN